jgi:hypothetical protein
VGYDAGKKVKGRKIHVLVDGEDFRCGSSSQSAAVQETENLFVDLIVMSWVAKSRDRSNGN